MKASNSIFLVLISLVITSSAYSQVTYGPIVGATISSLSKTDINGAPVYTIEGMKPGLLIGFFGRRTYPSEFFLQMGAEYRTFVGSTLNYNSTSADIGSSLLTFPIIVGSALSYNFDWRLGLMSSLRSSESDPDLTNFLENLGYYGGKDIEYDMEILIGLGARFSNINISLDYQRGIVFPAYQTDGSDHNSNIYTSQIVLTLGINVAN